jgi:radical SAM protein with 4Fe4S-binding SPASM domain
MLDERGEQLGIAHQFHKFIREFAKTTARQPKARDRRCPIVSDGLTAFVAATGDVLPCYALYMDGADTNQRYGNITEQRFRDIWTSHLRAQVIARIDARACPFCRFQGHNGVLWDLADQHADTTAPTRHPPAATSAVRSTPATRTGSSCDRPRTLARDHRRPRLHRNALEHSR